VADRSVVGLGFRAGNVLQVTLPLLCRSGPCGAVGLRTSRPCTIGVAVILLTGSPTTLIDTYNAQGHHETCGWARLPVDHHPLAAQQAGLLTGSG
jgi:hypothetical protein